MTRPLDPDNLVYELPSAIDAQLAPGGDRILYTLLTPDRNRDTMTRRLCTCALDGSDPYLLGGDGADEGGRWSPQGTAIAFVSDRDAGRGVFVGSERGEARLVSAHTHAVADLAWSGDGRRLAYTTLFDLNNPGEEERPAPPVRVANRLDYKRDGRGFVGDVRFHVFIADVESGHRHRVSEGAYDRRLPQWSPDGRTVAVQRTGVNGRTRLELIDVESGQATLVGPEEGVVALWAWSPSGDRILIVGEPKLTYQPDLFLYHVAGARLERLTDDLQVLPDVGPYQVLPPSQPVWLDDSEVLLHALRGGASGLYVVDVKGGALRTVASWDARHAGLSVDRDLRHAVQSVMRIDSIGEIAVFDPARQTLETITRHTEHMLASHPPAVAERFQVGRGGFEIEAWLLKPPDLDESRQYPVILDVHGGPNSFYGPSSLPLMQCLATHGFLVVYANPRGSTTYGRRFTQQVHRDWGGQDFGDLMAVLDRVLERPYADPWRTGIYGYSFGGFMTAWTIGHTDRFKAAVCGAPAYDLESHTYTADIALNFARVQFGGTPEEIPAWYAAHSPSNFVHKARTPTLIIQGEADDRCPVGQGQQLYTTLLNAGCEVEMALYPGASHLFFYNGRPAQREDFMARVLAWFQDHLMNEGVRVGEEIGEEESPR
jgi:dipeptidyl aminopeptidase/acylaminoacyl peptidase